MIKDITISKKAMETLEMLAYNISDMHYLKEQEQRTGEDLTHERNLTHRNIVWTFEHLDEEGVPFWLQNAVIARYDDWRVYSTTYFWQTMKAIEDKYNVRIEVAA